MSLEVLLKGEWRGPLNNYCEGIADVINKTYDELDLEGVSDDKKAEVAATLVTQGVQLFANNVMYAFQQLQNSGAEQKPD